MDLHSEHMSVDYHIHGQRTLGHSVGAACEKGVKIGISNTDALIRCHRTRRKTRTRIHEFVGVNNHHMAAHYHVHAKHTPALLGVLFILGLTQPARAQLGLALAPMRVELRMAPGQQYSGLLKLSSQSEERVRVRAEALDFNINAQATPQFEPELPQEAAYSCKKWLSINPMEIEIDKRATLVVRYTLQLPNDLAEGSYNCAAGFTTLPPAEQAQGMGMRVAVRVVASLYVVVGSPPILGRLKEIKLEPLASGKESDTSGWQAALVLENIGLMFYRPTGKLEVLDAQGNAVEKADLPSLPVLRQREQRFIFPLKTRLEEGHYKLRAQVDIGTGEIQQGSLDVSVEPPSQGSQGHTGSAPQPPQQ